jgi:hypothetical protein
MKSIDIGRADLNTCIFVAQDEPVMLTNQSRPLALIVGVNGMDEEQVSLGASSEFWTMIQARRAEPTLSRAELDNRLASQ